MFDLSWTEILVIGAAAIIFIGPKELPGALRTLGQWTAKARALAREFQNNVDDMVRESELDKIKNQVDQFGTGDLSRTIEQHIDPKGEMSQALSPPDLSLEGSTAGLGSDTGAGKPAETPSEAPTAEAAKGPSEAEPNAAPPKPA